MRVFSLIILIALTSVVANAAFTQVEVFQWDADHGITAESWDVSSLINPNDSIYFEFNYTTGGQTWEWGWSIDNVTVFDSDGDLIPEETFDTWLPTDWYQEQNGLDGLWEQLSSGYTSLPEVPYAGCDSDAHSGWAYDASLFTATVITDPGDVTIEFDSSFEVNGASGFEYATMYVWWEEGVGIESASLGEIKAAFK